LFKHQRISVHVVNTAFRFRKNIPIRFSKTNGLDFSIRFHSAHHCHIGCYRLLCCQMSTLLRHLWAYDHYLSGECSGQIEWPIFFTKQIDLNRFAQNELANRFESRIGMR